MPGRIVQALKKARTNNPVFMLDEIDKLGTDFRGDPSAALLEVLDPEQNGSFSDHFLSVPFDLSKVLFIATANMLDPIPAPLRDRMEIIQLSGYTPEEKVEIASQFLVPRQIEENGLEPGSVKFVRSAIESLATDYTREAGVRNLERQVGAVCRKVARKIAEGQKVSATINKRTLHRMLGPAYVDESARFEEGEMGVATGLAWTEAGGEVLQIEAALTRGEGLVLTGHLGDVMKESGQAALSYARSILGEIDVDEAMLSRHEVHVHVPAGATPKDGPSAGVTIATAMLSLATEIPVRADVAMTGEITLRGRVLPVGGVREKALAALRHGITTVIVPKANMQDVAGIPRELKKKITFVPVSTMREVLDAALEEPLAWRAPLRRTGGVTVPSGAPAMAKKR
jgi:ATP-dependent Lon protease